MTFPFEPPTPDHWANLLWALSAPDIASDFPLPWLPRERRHTLHQFFAAPTTAACLRPELELGLQTLNNHRLGNYFEQLWAFAFSMHPEYQLLARNLPLRDNEKTLGELDFVVRYLPDDCVEHWEVAVKFYLQVDDFWIGPGLRDRLDIKLARMREHQLPVIFQTEIRSQLQQSGLMPERQWAIMPGRLFQSLEAPEHYSQTPRYWWATPEQFQRYFYSPAQRWIPLQKPTWLAPVHVSAGTGYTTGTLCEHVLPPLLARGPTCLSATGSHSDRNSEPSRGFIVPADWYQRALTGIAD